MKIAVLIANRGFFPSSVIDSAREEMKEAISRVGAEALFPDADLTRYGAVETRAEGECYSEFLKKNAGEYDGLLETRLCNFLSLFYNIYLIIIAKHIEF